MSTDHSTDRIRRNSNQFRETVKIGDVFGEWTVIGELVRINRETKALCRCSCGTEKNVKTYKLKIGRTGSCGCMKSTKIASAKTTHGLSKTRLYTIWSAIIQRCEYEKNVSYKSYGDRGISMCKEWRENFQAFHDWAMKNGHRDDLTIERKDNEEGYCPNNCTWIPSGNQQLNKRNTRLLTAFGETKTITEWGRDPRCPVTHSGIFSRIASGWDEQRAISTPPIPFGLRNKKSD